MRFKVVIIHSDIRTARTVAERLTAYGCKIQAIGRTAEEARYLCRTYSVDALFMAEELPDANCIVLTAQLEREHPSPLLKIALAENDNLTLSNQFYNYYGDLYLPNPIDYVYCINKMEQYYRLRLRQGSALGPNPLVRGCTRKHLLRMKMPTNVRGFIYLLDCIELVLLEPELQHNLIQGLYTKVGALYQEPYTNIERCIRTAIEKAFESGDINYIYDHFGFKVREQTGKVKNGDFIEILAHIVRDDLNHWH